jgi:hypothetical protein
VDCLPNLAARIGEIRRYARKSIDS